MDLEEAEICGGCLSSGRRLQRLAGDAAAYYYEVIKSSHPAPAPAGISFCWECIAELRRASTLRQRMIHSAAVLLTLMHKNLCKVSSLSTLRKQTQTNIIYLTHNSTDYETKAAKERDRNNTRDEGESGIDVVCEDIQPIFVKTEGDGSFDDYFDERCSTPGPDVKTAVNKEEFVSSDDDPLTLKKKKKKEAKRSKKKKKSSDNSGVVLSARAEASLAALGVPPGTVQLVLLSWDEVEEERQRALRSEQYTRHSLRCEPCARGFNHSDKLRRHLDKHDPSSGAAGCWWCGVRCRSQRALQAHLRRHRLRWRCVECGALSSRAAVAADHLARTHTDTHTALTPTHTCSTCQYTAPSLGKLRSHMKSHSARPRCPLCDKTLRDRASLATHLFIHRGEKEHECPECGKRFLFKRALMIHRDTHTRPAPLYCPQCDVAFKNRMSYYQHMRYNLKHVHPDRLKHSCSDCGKKFVLAARLNEHRAAIHTGETPVRCQQPDCHFACASRAVLRAHVVVRHRGGGGGGGGGGGAVCHVCGNHYTTKKSLEKHVASHSTAPRPRPAPPAARIPAPLDN